MTKLCLECTKRYYFNTYTQNFPGEACPGPPSWAWLCHAGTPPPPRSTSRHGPGRVRRGIYIWLAYTLPNPSVFCTTNVIVSSNSSTSSTPLGSCRTSPQVDADTSRLIPGSAAKNSIRSLLGSLKPPGGTERDPVQKPRRSLNVTAHTWVSAIYK